MNVSYIAILIFGVCCIMPLAVQTQLTCTTPECYDCTLCEVDCNTVEEPCDSDCLAEARKFLCILENKNCKQVHGCNIPSVDITVWPAANHQITNDDWLPKTITARPNCCYDLSGKWDNTTSGITNNGQCVILYDGHGCTGASITVDNTWSQACLDAFTCSYNSAFNDKTSSFKLC